MLSIYRETKRCERASESTRDSENVIGEVRAVNCKIQIKTNGMSLPQTFSHFILCIHPMSISTHSLSRAHTHTQRTRLTQIITESQFYVHLISMTLATIKQRENERARIEWQYTITITNRQHRKLRKTIHIHKLSPNRFHIEIDLNFELACQLLWMFLLLLD